MALSAREIEFAYPGGGRVLAGVSLAAEPGEVVALVGPNGAGKSTLLRTLLGVLRPDSGAVTLDGEDVAAMTDRARARRLAYIPQRSVPAFSFSVRQVVAFGRHAAARAGGGREVDAALARVGLTDRADEPYAILSAGQQQRATLARALAQIGEGRGGAGRYLLADEPVSSMDPRHALEAMEILREVAGRGVGVLVVLHDLTIALRFADRALVLAEDGRLAADGPVASALDPAVLGRVFGVRFERLGGPEDAKAALVTSGLAPH